MWIYPRVGKLPIAARGRPYTVQVEEVKCWGAVGKERISWEWLDKS